MKCDELKELYNMQHVVCCESCHDDEAIGYSGDLWFTLGKDDYHVCCAMVREFDKRNKENQ